MITKAVIFDIDGLLVDTETVAAKVATEVCASIGIELTIHEQQQIVGVTAAKFFGDLFTQRSETKHNLSEIILKFHNAYEQKLPNSLKAFEGAKSVPESLKSKGLLLAVVSGSTKKQVEMILNFLGIENLFDVIVTAEDVTESKPSPAGYLLAAEKLGVDPMSCVVLEDATVGVKAAKDAGMKVIGVRNNGNQDLSLADEVVENLMEVQV